MKYFIQVSKHSPVTRGEFVMYNSHNSLAIMSLGKEIEVILRTVSADSSARQLLYGVEIVYSRWHSPEKKTAGSPLVLAQLDVHGTDTTICTKLLTSEAFGHRHAFGLQEYEIDSHRGFVLTIDGLLWDGELISVKDIAA